MTRAKAVSRILAQRAWSKNEPIRRLVDFMETRQRTDYGGRLTGVAMQDIQIATAALTSI